MKIFLSFSRIEAFSSCPLKYKYQFIDKAPFIPTVHTVFGKSLHEAVALFGESKKNETNITIEEMNSIFLKTWKNEVDQIEPKLEDEPTWIEKGKIYLKSFYRREGLKSDSKPFFIEKKFSFDVEENLKFTGIFDRVDKSNENEIVILEFKTHLNRAYSLLQLQLYCYSYLRLYKNLPKNAYLSSIESGEVIEYSPNNKEMNSVHKMILNVSNSIRGEKFNAKPSMNNCRFCVAKDKCEFVFKK
jgi:putative RecB family exonuclease